MVQKSNKFILRAMILSQSDILQIELPQHPAAKSSPPSPEQEEEAEGTIISDQEMKRRELVNLLSALKQSRWKIYGPGGAAELLGIKPTTLASRIKKIGLKKQVRNTKSHGIAVLLRFYKGLGALHDILWAPSRPGGMELPGSASWY